MYMTYDIYIYIYIQLILKRNKIIMKVYFKIRSSHLECIFCGIVIVLHNGLGVYIRILYTNQ